MAILTHKKEIPNDFKEVAVKPAVYLMLALVALVALPLGWFNLKIREQGSRVADTSRYQTLVETVQQDVFYVQAMIEATRVDDGDLLNALAQTPRLITPDILPTDMEEANGQNGARLKVALNAIYWSPTDPIVTINNENYHEGEKVQGHLIVEIRKTEVVFEDPMGEKVVKYFYEYLGGTE